VIRTATHVFTNIKTFGAVVNHELKTLFQEHAQDGLVIVASEWFVPSKFKLNDREVESKGTK
jgi:hypothetical protein